MYKAVFISHSRYDPNLEFFHKMFSAVPIEAIWMEFEDLKAPPYLSIKENVNRSDALFVLLSEHLVNKQYTSNWVSFEVGLAANRQMGDASKGLDVFVFEPLYQEIDFAVPYCTHFMRYPTTEGAFKWVRGRLRDGSLARSGFTISCVNDNCKIEFEYLSRFYTDSFHCPACKTEFRFQVSYKDIDLDQLQKRL